MTEISAKDMIEAVMAKKALAAREELLDMRLSEQQIRMIQNAEVSYASGEEKFYVTVKGMAVNSFLHACRQLVTLGMMYETPFGRPLTKKGARYRAALRHEPSAFEALQLKKVKKVKNPKRLQEIQDDGMRYATFSPPAPPPPPIEEAPQTRQPTELDKRMDINLGRDGLMSTVSKLWWIWNNGDTIKRDGLVRQYQEFVEGHNEVQEAAQLIASSEQRVARKLIDQIPARVESEWKEDDQRRTNDLYWMSGAPWLNPHGVLADATPAPDWWSVPEDYRSITERRLAALRDDTVDRSLLPPPGFVKATPEQIEQKRIEKADDLFQELDDTFDDLDEEYVTNPYLAQTEEQFTGYHLDLSQKYEYFVELRPVTDPDRWRYLAFRDHATLSKRLDDIQRMRHTIQQRGSQGYGDLLRKFAKQSPAASGARLDYLLDRLEVLGEKNVDSLHVWREKQSGTPVMPSKGPKGPVGPKGAIQGQGQGHLAGISVNWPMTYGAPRPKEVVRVDEGFCMVEFNGEVRGFASRSEAQEYLREAKEQEAAKAAITSKKNRERLEDSRRINQSYVKSVSDLERAKLMLGISSDSDYDSGDSYDIKDDY